MKINLSGHHVDVTDTVKEHVNEKLSKIGKHFPSLIALDVTIPKSTTSTKLNYEHITKVVR